MDNDNDNTKSNNKKLYEICEKERKKIATSNANLSKVNYQLATRMVNIFLTGFDSYAKHCTNASLVSKYVQDVMFIDNKNNKNTLLSNSMPINIKSKVFETMHNMSLSSLRFLRYENSVYSKNN